MSWMPGFEIGLWNAWILMLIYPLQPLILQVVDKAVGTGDINKKMGDNPTDQQEKKVYAIYMAVLIALLAYSIFLPLKPGTAWFYAGLTIYLLGLAAAITTIANIATTPPGQIFTRGTYRFSRHPGYLSMMIMLVGAGLASTSWLFLLLAAALIFLTYFQIKFEERGCLQTFGGDYQAYMDKTPRWIGVPKSK